MVRQGMNLRGGVETRSTWPARRPTGLGLTFLLPRSRRLLYFPATTDYRLQEFTHGSSFSHLTQGAATWKLRPAGLDPK